MKKILALTALMILSTSSFVLAGSLATQTVSNAGTAIYGGANGTAAGSATSPLFKLSTGVSTLINFDSAGVGYAVFTKHVKGTKVFGTAYDSTAISYIVEAAGIMNTTTPGSVTAIPSGWTTM